jgi:hypothetical protein
VDNADWIGHSLLSEAFWKQRIARLKDLERGFVLTMTKTRNNR